MTESSASKAASTGRLLLSKVPEVTVWFWVIKILCTTVGESFADWINMALGVGLIRTALIFTVVLGAVLGWQLRLDRYVPFVYWLTVVVLSVTGTLYTDILTDQFGVPLALSTTMFAVVLAVVFGVWYLRERTLSIHSIVTRPRELFYWLAVLVTFALGTAVGDWVLQLTGWGPGRSVLLPAGLILAIVIGWRLGANAVLGFWLAYILTRPLGANLGDWLATPSDTQGIGLGTALASVIFLVAILSIVVFLSITRRDVIKNPDATVVEVSAASPARERIMLGYFGLVAAATAAVLVWAAGQPHVSAAGEEESGVTPVATEIAPGEVTARFSAPAVTKFRTITQDLLAKVRSGDQSGATMGAKGLEASWDDDEPTLRPMDETAWRVIDSRVDNVLKAIRADLPDPVAETQALEALSTALR
ncbi:hypothetical protein FZI91_16185 [Mycobacterium sp. CBMA271]|uniref:COG4705 family protein n=1 Tax=unclassified Mycobacteroides TaxID=2618759 RepID=UPI0012DE9CB8|nr:MULTISPECIES: hypothetical protein [unclassified Mycobacteroides]MUM18829.1 hypothetical protein [Mycobacteroides sp. CBMA 326]MUM23230.1 hypothetical protein [Mycobacteroides sp. CBMA 271]